MIVGNFFSIATDKPKKITEKIIPHSIISEKVIARISILNGEPAVIFDILQG